MSHAMAHKSAGTGVVGVAAMAALVGAAAALLFAPKSGRETRGDIRRRMMEAQERTKQKTSEMKDAAGDKVDMMRGKAEETAADVKDAATEARSQVEDATIETRPRSRSRRTTTL